MQTTRWYVKIKEKKKKLITKEKELTLQVYNLPMFFFLVHTQHPDINSLPHNVTLYLFQTTGQVTSFSGSLRCSGLRRTSFLSLTTVYLVIPPYFGFSGLLRNRT